jgi:hypothetical protein
MAGLDAPPARPTAADRYLEPGDLGRLGGGKSSWCWSATRSKAIGPPQDGQAVGSGTLTTWSTRSGTGRRARLP